MVNVSIDLKDTSGYAPALGDRVIFEAKRLAGSPTTPGRVVTTAPVEVQLRNGVGEVDLEPGTTVMRIKARNYRDARAIEFDVPEVSRDMTLRELLEDSFTYSPSVIQDAQLHKMQAREAAERAEAAARVVGSAKRVEEWSDAAVKAAKESEASAGAAKEASEASAGSASASANSAGEAGESATLASSSAGAAESHARRAESHANEAGSHASASSESAKSASTSAEAASGSFDMARKEADRAASQAGNAATFATEASTHADRAEGVADSVQWDDDRLTVAGKTSPSLRGPKGDRGAPGESGASTWGAVEGKPDVFPPAPHTHQASQIHGLDDAISSSHAYVDDRADELKAHIEEKVAELQALIESRPAFFSGAGAPPGSIPGASVGDYYLDTGRMSLHRITGV